MDHPARLLPALLLWLALPGAALAASVCGTVTDSDSNQPVAQAAVFLFDDLGDYTGLYAGTDAAGWYCIEGVPPGQYTLQVRRDDYLESVITNVLVEDTTTGIDVGLDALLSLRAWPNPVATSLQLALRAPAGSELSLEVFDLAGRRVRAWAGRATGERTTLQWDLRDWQGKPVASGPYFLRLRSGDAEATRRILHLR